MTLDTHRWIHETPRVRPDGTRIAHGETFTPTDLERRSWPRRIEPVDVDDLTESEGEGEDKPLPFNPESHTNDEIAEKVADIDDVDTVEALRYLETTQRDRVGAIEVIDDRLDELDGDSDAEPVAEFAE